MLAELEKLESNSAMSPFTLELAEAEPVAKPAIALLPEVLPALESSPAALSDGGELVTLTKVEAERLNRAVASKKDPRFLGIKASRWTATVFGVAALDLIFRDPILMSIGLLAGMTKLAAPHLNKVGGSKLNLRLATIAGVAITGGLGLHLYTSSAQALFFQEAENFLSTTFDLSGTAVATIFNVFRAVYVIYLIYSAISIWTAYNRDEEWQSVAKAPIVIFVGGTLIDAVTTIITT